MILDKVLLLKGLGGLITCTGLGCGATYLINPDLFKTNDQILAELISKVGLKTCTTTSPDCSIEDSGLNLKQDNEKLEKKTKQNPSSGTAGKIKVYANNSDYNKGFKFVIEDGDITLTGGTQTQITKLEQFETYEIKEDGGKWYLTRKSTAIDEIKKSLNLPSSCTLVTTETTDSCTFTEEQLKTINFKDKGAGQEISVASGVTTKLTIVKSSDTEFATEGYKFIFKTTGDVTISTNPSNKIKKDTNTEFKIKKEANKWTLEKAWTVTTLGAKVGLTGCESTTKECSLPTSNNINLYNSESDKTTSVTIKSDSQSKKLKYEEDQEGFNQGFKFYVEEEIVLTESNDKKIAKKENNGYPAYEIKKQTVDNATNWYLSKKEAPAS